MRLTSDQIAKISQAVDKNVPWKFKLYLYGSRIDDNLKGGDIDLLLLVDSQQELDTFAKKFKILVEMKREIGDQKIDLTISTFDTQDVFINGILSDAILL